MAQTPEIVLIAALDRARAIGVQGDLPWHLPADWRRFKERTREGVVLMGRRTAESLPCSLPDRRNLVLTRGGHVPYPEMESVSSVAAARQLADPKPLLVIGGAEIYSLALPVATQMWLTHVDLDCPEADTWFPAFEPADWEVTSREFHEIDEKHAASFSFVDYRRRGSPEVLSNV